MQLLSFILIFFASSLINSTAQTKSWIRINQLGYLNNSVKNAVFVSKEDLTIGYFEIVDDNEKIVFTGTDVKSFGNYGAFKSTFRLNFSMFNISGVFKIKTGEIESPSFKISPDVYDGTADFVLQYMRQQRCGYNPFLKDSCHTYDGFIVDHPTRTGEHIDVTGGWHDAADYLQYLTTSATAAYQMMFAYKMNPNAFGDYFEANGNKGENGIPDILDEAKWGLDWLNKMNPEKNVMFNQIADDRDHAGFRLPNYDSVNYGKNLERPVYFITGNKQGICNHKNRTTGVSSSAAKYASAFALGAELMKIYYPEFSSIIKEKAFDAYEFAKSDLGVCQTTSCKSPYFYEEDNYIDDLELAAAQLFTLSNEAKYLTEAIEWGKVEPVTPWMGTDTMRHYQWYPFLNLGHVNIIKSNPENILIKKYLREGLNKIFKRGNENPFNIGIPFIWCSNNLVSAAVTQSHLYRKMTGDSTFSEMEAALLDWLFGCNPWGTSMVVGLPADGDYPQDPHSSLWIKENYLTTGGLVDGPIYSTIFNYLEYLKIVNGDEYEEFQSREHVYHDDYGDYSTNEPTMDGTASLTYILSALQQEGSRLKIK
ncbi:MAG: glycoside hydrolase [Ignavibacteria bacterium CG2_30_36_16]|nr:glycoside hydrolase [Ignavibacteria bacterium]OIP55137.1 MAG: glycoside hydrolase [Ignavibacteria bacterium CG2_30_36_16]PJA98985.1 MAG: glycoside hydrolase [Ignavibacteria bacterium CG_4_9_14_3_um_filter_36_18]